MAVGPEPTVDPPYLHWRVADAADTPMAGARFEVQRSQATREWDWWSWSYQWTAYGSFSTVATVSDCTAGCSIAGDRDHDAGEFQLTSGVLTDTGDVRYRYRIRAVDSASGPLMANSSWTTESRAADWGGSTFDFGTFSAALRPALACVGRTFYAVLSDGTVRQVVRSNNGTNTATVTSFGNWGSGLSSVNALGIGQNGTLMYALERSSSNAANVASILRYSTTDGWQSIPGSSYVTGNSIALVAGGVSPADGRFYFGGFHEASGSSTLSFRLHRFDLATGTSSVVGTFPTAVSRGTTANGDMAFDASGNLTIVRSGAGDANSYTVAAAALAGANGGSLPASASAPQSLSLSAVNGAAFDGDGSIYLGNGNQVLRYDPVTFEQLGSSVTTSLASGGSTSSDLASCGTPPTLTIRKDVQGRVAASDQFRLELRSTTGLLASATTSGAQSGIQQAVVGPIAVVADRTYTIAEVMASGSADDYAESWSCTSNGTAIASGTRASGSITIPNQHGANVICTFSNAPLVTQVTIRKVVQDAAGGNPQPGNGWTVSATATGTGGTITPGTIAGLTNASGSATWALRHSAPSATAAIAVAETQRPGYAFASGRCVVTPPTGTATTVTITGATGTTVPAVRAGSSVDCEFVNRLLPTTLTLAKDVSFGDQAASTWHLSATGPQSARPGPAGVTGEPAATAEITPGVAYRLAESGGPATYVQIGNWACRDELGASIAVTAAGDVTVNRTGAHVTCTVTNQTARLTLIKTVVNDNGGTLGADDFALTATPASAPAVTGLAAFTVTGVGTATAANTREVRPGHAYALTEDMGEYAYLGQSIQRYSGPPNPTTAHLAHDGNWTTLTTAQAAALTLVAGEHAYVRFVNDDAPALSLPLTGGIGADTYLLGGAGVLLLGLLVAAVLLVRTRIRSGREARLT
ncbi:prealbumin-like fold domain-containing protein [Agrococcus baldri]|nr:hypothetical protein [Agrococcus baldri]